MYKVQGRVTFETKPMAGAVITFHSARTRRTVRPRPMRPLTRTAGMFCTRIGLMTGAPAGDHHRNNCTGRAASEVGGKRGLHRTPTMPE